MPFGDETVDEAMLRELEDQLESGPNSSQMTLASEDMETSTLLEEPEKHW